MREARFNLAPLALAAVMTVASAAVASSESQAQTAQAQTAEPSATRRTAVSLAAQPLGSALNALARQADLQMSYPAGLVAGKSAPAVDGSMTVREALDRVLAGSGLSAELNASTVVVRQAALPGSGATSALPAVQVSATTMSASGDLYRPYAGGQVARGGRVGLLGNRDMMDTPFSTTQYTAEMIADQQAQNIGEALINDPTIRNTYSRGAAREEFNIRGFTLFNYDVSYNGLYGVAPRNASSLIGIERVEVLRGPSALLNGMAPNGSVGGAINLVPKRAGSTPLNRLTLSYIDDGQIGTHVDVGRRFGPTKQWGIRVNGLYRSGDTPVDDSRERIDAFSVGVDYQGERLRLEADFNYQNRVTHARGGLLFAPPSGIAIGGAPKATSNWLPSWSYWRADEISAIARAEWDLTTDWTLFGAAGTMQYDFRSLQTSWLMQNTAGLIGAVPARLNEYVDTNTAEAGLRGRFQTGALRHEAVTTVSSFELEGGLLRVRSGTVLSNLYSPQTIARPDIVIGSPIPKANTVKLHSIAIADTISTADRRAQLTIGARHQQVETASFDTTNGVRSAHYDESAVTPTLALVFKPVESLSLYGNYIEGLSQGGTAPSAAANAGEVFRPGKSRQAEVGAKIDFGRMAATLSVFQIERPSGYLSPTTLRYAMDGEQRNRGLELLTFGELSRGVRLLAGMAFTDGEMVRTEGGLNDGRTAPATPRLQMNIAGEWDPAAVPGLTLTARAIRTGSQYVDIANTQQIPAWTRYDIGARYTLVAGRTPVTIRAAVENLLDRNYWLSAAREGLTVGAPRTFLMSVSAAF